MSRLPLAVTLALCLVGGRATAWQPLRAATTGVPAHWETQFIPWERANDPAELPTEDAERLIRQAFAAWQAVPCHLLSFVELPPGQGQGLTVDGHNRVRFVRVGWFGSPAEVAIASTTIHDETGRIIDADLALNDEGFELVDGVGRSPDAVDLGGVLTHELGHFLGLGHSGAGDATMRTYLPGSGVADLATLAPDDVVGLCSLYEPAAPLPEEGRAPAGIPPGAPLMLAGVGLALVGTRRRAGVALAVAVASASPRCAGPGEDPMPFADAVDAAQDVGPAPGDSAAPPDVGADVATADATADANADAGSVVAEALLLSETAWVVTGFETLEEPGFPADTALELPASGAPLLSFLADGRVIRARAGDGSTSCASLGTWEASGDTVSWRFPTEARFCPSAAPTHAETLRVTLDPETGAPALLLLDSTTPIGTSGRTIRPYRATLAPASVAPDPAMCPAPHSPAPCTLSCWEEGEGLARVPMYALGCGTEAPVCSVLTDAVTGLVTRRQCQDGCQTVTCDLTDDGGACAAEPAGAKCAWGP